MFLKIMIKFLKYISILIVSASLIVHILTFVPDVKISMDQVFVLHILCILAFGSIFLTSRKVFVLNKKRRILRAFYNVLKVVNRKAFFIGVFFFVYAFINFFIFFLLMQGGSLSSKNGSYYLHNHGKIIRELTETEYNRYQAYEVRGFSGHWIIFSLMPAIFYFNRENILKVIQD